MEKTTLTLIMPVELHLWLKARAAQTGVPMSTIVQQGVRWEQLLAALEENGGALYLKESPEDELTRIVRM